MGRGNSELSYAATALSMSGKTARTSSARLLPSQTLRPPRCWLRLLQPPEIQYPLRVELSPYLKDYRATLLRHPAAQWAAGIYRLDRGYSAEIAKRMAAP